MTSSFFTGPLPVILTMLSMGAACALLVIRTSNKIAVLQDRSDREDRDDDHRGDEDSGGHVADLQRQVAKLERDLDNERELRQADNRRHAREMDEMRQTVDDLRQTVADLRTELAVEKARRTT